MRAAIVVIAMLVSAAAAAEEPVQWKAPSAGEYACLGAAVASVWVDVGMTRAYTSRPYPTTEANPLLGPHPSQARIFWIGGVAATALLTGVWFALPSKVRYIPCVGVVVAEGFNIPMMAVSNGGFAFRF